MTEISYKKAIKMITFIQEITHNVAHSPGFTVTGVKSAERAPFPASPGSSRDPHPTFIDLVSPSPVCITLNEKHCRPGQDGARLPCSPSKRTHRNGRRNEQDINRQPVAHCRMDYAAERYSYCSAYQDEPRRARGARGENWNCLS